VTSGYLDADGFLYIVDRAEGHDHHGRLQRLLGRSRAGADAAPRRCSDSAVIGLPDEKWGEQVVAVV
jgi:fatty-acyl-CoA synthase